MEVMGREESLLKKLDFSIFEQIFFPRIFVWHDVIRLVTCVIFKSLYTDGQINVYAVK